MGTAKVSCVYIGSAPLRLSADHGPHRDGDDKPLKSMNILPGHTLMMSEEEVNGVTFWHDPRGILPSEKLGPGRVVKAEHQGLDLETLMMLGYDFHDGRSDFLTCEQAQAQAPSQTATATPSAPSAPSVPKVATPENAVPAPSTILPLPPLPITVPTPTPSPRPWTTTPSPALSHEEQERKDEEVQ
jgi:hypothetical protein